MGIFKLKKLKTLKKIRKGFTLIELLIVIAVLGVLAAAILATIDPIDKLNAGNDSKVQSDIAQIIKAAQAYAATNGSYPTSLTTFGTELRTVPSAPSGYAAYSYTVNAGEIIIVGEVKAKNNKQKAVAATAALPANAYYKYSSINNKTCYATASTATACP